MSIYYNENGKLQFYEETTQQVICPNCRKRYIQHTEEQVAGFRDMSYDVCPYCNSENGRSMSVEYSNEKID